jgi:glycyl-tRNA synthetase beta chain
MAFFHDRLIVQLKDSGIRHDVIKAVIAGGDDDLVRIVNKAKAVQAFLDTDDGKNLLAGYKRAAKIVADEEKKNKTTYGPEFDNMLLKQHEELKLRFYYTPAQNEELIAWEKNEEYARTMGWLATLREPLNDFFDKVLVNCEDEAIRVNRLRLLTAIRDLMSRVADFSKIEG